MKWIEDSPGRHKLVNDDDSRPESKTKTRRFQTGLILGKGARPSFDYLTPEGKKHTISTAHYKDITSRKLNPDGSVSRRGKK